MLLYDHKQQFIGIDDEGLRLLNYASLEELLSVCSDVADLFANEPGYIHNFKGFGWIDFLLHADSDASSALVHGNGRTFSCRLSVTPFHLCDHPAQSAYRVEMSQVKNLSGEEFKPHTIVSKAAETEIFAAAPEVQEPTPSPLPDYTHLTPTRLSEPTVLDIPEVEPVGFDELEDIYADLTAPLSEKELDTFPEEKPSESLIPAAPVTEKPIIAEKPPMLGDTRYSSDEKEFLSHHKVDRSYKYDPNIAANELGLPVDLIEEFIGDFIQQSHDFKEELFQAVLKSDFNNLHILSHKLKGVAANLRVEDAFETLSVINTSTDLIEVEANLKYFYSIIAKLEGKDLPEESYSSSAAEPLNEPEEYLSSAQIAPAAVDDIYAFSLKQDNEPLIIHEEEILREDEIVSPPIGNDDPFKKEFLTLHEDILSQPDTVKTEENFLEEPLEDTTVTLHYDLNSIAGALGIEPMFMEELLRDYKNDAQTASQKITQAINAFDTHTWKENASKLKGISDNLRLTEISEELALLSKTNDAQEAKKASARLVSYLNQL
ncbi:MAG TPA: hypothetical protein VFX57_01300 [Sulfuricurvum sp.]|nr:hypothetical protein [Sulfuricurvum sp.]